MKYTHRQKHPDIYKYQSIHHVAIAEIVFYIPNDRIGKHNSIKIMPVAAPQFYQDKTEQGAAEVGKVGYIIPLLHGHPFV